MPDPTPPSANPRGPAPDTPANRFFQKLGVYLLGVAIGLIFLGWVQYRKHQAVQAQQQTQQQTREQTQQPSQQDPFDTPPPSDPSP
ncbi:MAG: hypothetical protein LAT64_00635 [Phycisphaerales bacterium]|nr:hypothetical protein [Planctomycetota bacterium]MCH8507268.1 hypothetical protein [Phycisphaerales bacterium]